MDTPALSPACGVYRLQPVEKLHKMELISSIPQSVQLRNFTGNCQWPITYIY